MPSIHHEDRTVSFKIVYCGTPLCGKTTNIQQIHAKLDPRGRSDLVSLSTAQDRTLFFDFLSIEADAIPGYKTTFHLYTVPGQVTYNATLQLVLRQADAVVFVIDSQMDRQRDNLQAFQSLEANLRLNDSSIERLPVVLQYNKRDLPNAAPVEYLEYLFNNRPVPLLSFEADARGGRNVLATLNAVSQAVLHQFRLAHAPVSATTASRASVTVPAGMPAPALAAA
ncbi:MAG: GTPase domain-containing protein [Verrucomicrobiaceae bacterium]|nr:GTPase domain-containing protein [Verrucomicrobiaceae bacterium]